MQTASTFKITFLLTVAAVLTARPGQAQFAAARTYSAGINSSPEGVALGDVDGDGNLDIVTANSHSDNAGVLLGRADGSFAPVAVYATGAQYSHPYSVALGDLNEDGRLDLAVSNFGTRTVSVLLGLAGGRFAAARPYATGGGISPYVVAVGDVNTDGHLDLVTGNGDGNSAGVLLGRGNGTFAAVTNYSTGTGRLTEGIALGDVNGDGRPDIVTADALSSTASVLLGQAGGGFAPASSYSAGAGGGSGRVSLGDVNQDGRLDIVTSNFVTSTVGVLLGQAGGGFAPVSTYSTGTYTLPYDAKLGDVNNDGRLDIVTANSSPSAPAIGVLLGMASGGFAPAVSYPTGAGLTYPITVALGDVNRDGLLDAVVANSATPTVGVLLNATVQASPVPVRVLTAALTLCHPDTLLRLTATPAGGTWRGRGITDAQQGVFSTAAAGPGRHVIRYEQGRGARFVADSVALTVSPSPVPVLTNAGPVLLRCGQADALVGVAMSLPAGTRYEWQYAAGPASAWQPLAVGNGQAAYRVARAGRYRVRTAQGECAAYSAPVEVHVEPLQAQVVPNVFTPNHDGLNDRFELVLSAPQTFQLDIFNRWGQAVFTTHTYGDFWTGQGAPAGVYYYRGRYSTDCEPTEHVLSGWVQLVI